ncbi:helix-turn-helix domain-containing protein [Gracilibacillus dipsosauri]|uniref:helix-turn-helix domain-containing protein n=1 Tax=Gracilibacillus dipsosauri TaxID=178340 RepID=UPI0024091FF5
MVNIMKLKGKIVERGMNVGQLAEKMGIDRATLYRRINNNGDSFTIREANQICEILDLSKEEAIAIFFKNEVA